MGKVEERRKPKHKFNVGELAWHDRVNPKDPAVGDMGTVTGFGASGENGPWLRVKTFDGRHRAWLKNNCNNVMIEAW